MKLELVFLSSALVSVATMLILFSLGKVNKKEHVKFDLKLGAITFVAALAVLFLVTQVLKGKLEMNIGLPKF